MKRVLLARAVCFRLYKCALLLQNDLKSDTSPTHCRSSFNNSLMNISQRHAVGLLPSLNVQIDCLIWIVAAFPFLACSPALPVISFLCLWYNFNSCELGSIL